MPCYAQRPEPTFSGTTRYGEKKLKTLIDQKTLDEFVEAVKDAAGYSPNHPSYVTSWDLVLDTGAEPMELVCHYEAAHPADVVADFVRKEGNMTAYSGTCKSRNLKAWFKNNVE